MQSLLRRNLVGVGAVHRFASTSTVARPVNEAKSAKENNKTATPVKLYDRSFGDMFPDMLPTLQIDRRNALAERLTRRDQLRRRVHLDIPEFYVGSLVAVTYSDKYAPSRQIRFMGMCISRDHTGLKHQIMLRNCFDGLGVQVPFDLYNPLVIKVEVIRLQRHADPNMNYMKDALNEYSTFDTNMPAVPHPPGAPVPECPLVIKLKPPPWAMRLHAHEYKGIDSESLWSQTTPWFKKKFHRRPINPLRKYDIVRNYREEVNRDDQEAAFDEMKEFVVRRSETAGLGEHLKKHRRRHLYPPVAQTSAKGAARRGE